MRRWVKCGAVHRIGWPLCPRALGECSWLHGVAVGGGRRVRGDHGIEFGDVRVG